MAKYIYQNKDWTNFTWSNIVINAIFGEVRNLQGKLSGQMSTLGFSTKEEATLTTLTLDIVKSSEIEGEQLNYEQVRSSKWARIVKYSPDTALRDIKDLIEKGILQQEQEGGRSTNYELTEF